MPNPLQRGNVPPPPPEMSGQVQAERAGAPSPILSAVAPAQPAPTHAQTVAAMRHFSALINELETLRKNPNLGKASIKKDIIEGVTKLVADEFMTADKAVAELATVPERPFDQKAWVEKNLATVTAAAGAVLNHHRGAFPGSLDHATESAMSADPKNHADDMAGLMSHYQQPAQA